MRSLPSFSITAATTRFIIQKLYQRAVCRQPESGDPGKAKLEQRGGATLNPGLNLGRLEACPFEFLFTLL
jgi:hypothetical protein